MERDVEKLLIRRVRQLGGVCYKWTSPGTAGVPDRIVILPDGRISFVELKTDTGRLSEVQRYQIRRLRDLGCDVRVLYGRNDVEEWYHAVCAAQLSETGD